MIEANKISFYPFGNFLIARVAVSGAFLRGEKPYTKQIKPFCPQGYDLYYSLNGRELIKYFNDLKFTSTDELYIYCIKNGRYDITIPYGVSKTETSKGYNFTIKLTCEDLKKVIEKTLSGYFMHNAWNYLEKDGLVYEFISEFYIKSDQRLSGLSIALRNEFSEIFEGFSSETEIEEAIKKAINVIQRKYNDIFKFYYIGPVSDDEVK